MKKTIEELFGILARLDVMTNDVNSIIAELERKEASDDVPALPNIPTDADNGKSAAQALQEIGEATEDLFTILDNTTGAKGKEVTRRLNHYAPKYNRIANVRIDNLARKYGISTKKIRTACRRLKVTPFCPYSGAANGYIPRHAADAVIAIASRL